MRQRLPRIHNERHLDFIRSLFCVSCGDDTSTEAAHLRSANRLWGKNITGKQEKPSDFWVLPLCGRCHREQHSMSEVQFYQDRNINPWELALKLFAASGDFELAHEVIQGHSPS